MGSILESSKIDLRWAPTPRLKISPAGPQRAGSNSCQLSFPRKQAIPCPFEICCRSSARWPARRFEGANAGGGGFFGRSPDYDTNADPVGRISAGEVRKRIAQYYHESGAHSRVQIEIPLGSYMPEFQLATKGEFRPPRHQLEGVASAERPIDERRGRRGHLIAWLSLGLVVLAGGVYASIVHLETGRGKCLSYREQILGAIH